MAVLNPSYKFAFLRMFRLRARSELKELYMFTLIYAFAFSLITIFEPVFFYQEGFSLTFIALYYAFHYTLYAIIMPFGGKFVARFGLERSLAISLPIFIAYFLTLAAVPKEPRLIWLAIVLLSCHKIFYWPAFHAYFAKFSDGNNTGTELSWMRLLRFGVGILGPLVGGFVAAIFGFPVLFMMTAVMVLFSAVPLLKTKEQYSVSTFPYSTPWKLIRQRKYRRMTIGMLGQGENLIDMVIWPIFLFIVLGGTSQLGIVTSISIAIMTAMSFLIGEMSDRMPRRYVLRLHLPFMMIAYLFRPLATFPLQALLTDILNKMSYSGVNLPTLHRLYVEARSAGYIRYMISFELVLCIAKAVTAYILAIIFAISLPYVGFTAAFVLASMLALFYVRL